MTVVDKTNPKMLVLARESKGLQQVELARKANLTQGALSKMERGELRVSDDLVKRFARILDYPKEHFYQTGSAVPPILSHKRKSRISTRQLSRIDASVNIVRLLVEKLTAAVEVNKFDSLTPRAHPSVVAAELRREWGIKRGVVDNIVEVLEANGIFVIEMDFGTDALESRPILTTQRIPLLAVNNCLLGDRQRYTLAFELGHLVLHVFQNNNNNSKDLRHTANLFAAEFLMPKDEILNDFQNDVTIDLLASLKAKWRVSMQALLYRAHDLGRISDNQKRYLVNRFSQLGIRKREPPELDAPKESPSLLKNLVGKYQKEQGLTLEKTAQSLLISKGYLVGLID